MLWARLIYATKMYAPPIFANKSFMPQPLNFFHITFAQDFKFEKVFIASITLKTISVMMLVVVGFQ